MSRKCVGVGAGGLTSLRDCTCYADGRVQADGGQARCDAVAKRGGWGQGDSGGDIRGWRHLARRRKGCLARRHISCQTVGGPHCVLQDSWPSSTQRQQEQGSLPNACSACLSILSASGLGLHVVGCLGANSRSVVLRIECCYACSTRTYNPGIKELVSTLVPPNLNSTTARR